MTTAAASTEYEAKILSIDPDSVAGRVRAAGGVHVADRLLRRLVYDVAPSDARRWIRLRDTGDSVTLCLKEIVADTIDGVRETEFEVSDFAAAAAFLTAVGFPPKAYQENRRSSWLLGTVRLELDSWPLIPPYLEIEADSVAEVRAAAERLGFDPAELVTDNTTGVYARYGIDLAAIPDLRFR